MSFFILLSLISVFDQVEAQDNTNSGTDYTQYVYPFYGSINGGNTFPGVVPAPHSVVKLGIDVYTGSDEYSGYATTGNISGYSMMHESGTGGAPKYGTVAQMPLVGNISNPLLDQGITRSQDDQATVGWYQTSQDNGVTVQLAATNHAGMFSYQFPSNDTANVVIDVSHCLPDFRGLGWAQNYINGDITIGPDGHYEGSGTYNGGWNLSPDWTIYFCGYFDSNATVKTFSGNGTTLYDYSTTALQSGSQRVGAVYSFSKSTVNSRVGISFVSSANACSFVNDEIPQGTTLNTLITASKNAWNTLLSRVSTTDTSDSTLLGLLYTSMYGMFIIPSNRTGDMPGWGTEFYYDDWFTLWDLFRCSTSLMHILSPTSYTEMIQSLVNIYEHDGWMPDARSSNYNGRSQGGSNADNVLADAYVKGIDIDWTAAYAAMLKDAEITPPNNNDPISPTDADNQGRGALPDWLSLGWISPNYNRAVSRAIEYSANDFGLYQVAKGLGLSSDASKYLTRSRNWRNHYNPSSTSLDFTGFLVPRNSDGTFVPQDPLSCGSCYWGDAYYEATPWEYLFNPTHDILHLVNLTGGSSAFADKLSTIFTPGLGTNTAFNNTIMNPGNEPSFTSPYLFNYVGRQDLSVKYSRFIASTYYTFSAGGLPGNSDAGAMQSWWLWNFIGLYPITSQTTFLIGSPWLNDLSIKLGDDTSSSSSSSSSSSVLRITSQGTGQYVQSLRVNGQDWNKSWLEWDDIFSSSAGGGGKGGGNTMEFILGEEPNGWAAEGELPPSPAS